jgi:hypothetical protein
MRQLFFSPPTRGLLARIPEVTPIMRDIFGFFCPHKLLVSILLKNVLVWLLQETKLHEESRHYKGQKFDFQHFS